MTPVTLSEFQGMLSRAISATLETAEKSMSHPLPRQVVLELGALGHGGREVSMDEVSDLLYNDGQIPRGIVIGVKGLTRGRALIWLGPTGHGLVSDLEETFNGTSELGPFNPVGLMLRPGIWKRPQPFSLRDVEDSTPDWARA